MISVRQFWRFPLLLAKTHTHAERFKLWPLRERFAHFICIQHIVCAGIYATVFLFEAQAAKWGFARLSKRIFHRFAELPLVAFEREQVITTLLDYLLCNAGLAAHGVNRYQRILDIK